MPSYSFSCRSKRHENDETRDFTAVIHLVKEKRVDQIQCPECGGLAKRDFVKDVQTVGIVGSAPMSLATTGKGSLSKAAEFAFGKFRQNPDGSVDTNHTRFDTIKDMDRYANGHNDLGPPRLDDHGNPMRRPDGSMIRTGAKLFKIDSHRRPPVQKKRRVDVPSAWVGDDVVEKATGARPMRMSAPRYVSPQRGKK